MLLPRTPIPCESSLLRTLGCVNATNCRTPAPHISTNEHDGQGAGAGPLTCGAHTV